MPAAFLNELPAVKVPYLTVLPLSLEGYQGVYNSVIVLVTEPLQVSAAFVKLRSAVPSKNR